MNNFHILQSADQSVIADLKEGGVLLVLSMTGQQFADCSAQGLSPSRSLNGSVVLTKRRLLR